MRTWNRKASFDVLVALERLMRNYVSDFDAFAESLPPFCPTLFSRSPMSTNNFRAFYINDANFDSVKRVTILERRWESKSGRSYTRNTERLTNRRLVQRALDIFDKSWFEEREDFSLENSVARQLAFLWIAPFDMVIPKTSNYKLVKVKVPKDWAYDTLKYTIE